MQPPPSQGRGRELIDAADGCTIGGTPGGTRRSCPRQSAQARAMLHRRAQVMARGVGGSESEHLLLPTAKRRGSLPLPHRHDRRQCPRTHRCRHRRHDLRSDRLNTPARAPRPTGRANADHDRRRRRPPAADTPHGHNRGPPAKRDPSTSGVGEHDGRSISASSGSHRCRPRGRGITTHARRAVTAVRRSSLEA